MEYGSIISKCGQVPCPGGKIMNEDYYRYVGHDVSTLPFDNEWFSETTLRAISNRLNVLLKCLRKDGRPVIVSDRIISHMT